MDSTKAAIHSSKELSFHNKMNEGHENIPQSVWKTALNDNSKFLDTACLT